MRKISFVLFAIPLAVSAQTVGPLPPLTEQVEVHVVNVDVSVTDRNGAPVSGLTKEDFEIFEDGQPQKVTNFAAVNTVAPAPEGRRMSTDVTRRILLIVDNNFLGKIDRNRALDVLQKYLDTSFNGEWAVAAITNSVEMLQSFTSDKKLIDAGIAKVRAMPSAETQYKVDRAPLSEQFNHRSDITTIQTSAAKFAFSSREQTFRNLLAIQNTARAVVDTAHAYAGEGGKKFMILLTGGIENNTTYSAYEKANDPELRELRLQMGEISDAMVREANGANFTLHVINARPRGMASPQADVTNRSSGNNITGNLLHDVANQPIDVSDVDTIPLSIALGTGGMYLPSNDVGESLKKIDTTTSNFYSLGYTPQHNGDRQYHTIKVRVKKQGVRIANRVGYFDETPEDRFEQMLRARMTFDSGFGSLPVKLQVGEASPGDRDLVVRVTAAMPLARITVVPQEKSYVGRIHVYCSVFDENGHNVGFSHKTQQVAIPAQELSGPGQFRYTIPVHVKKGQSFTVVITLRDELSNEIGSASEAVRL